GRIVKLASDFTIDGIFETNIGSGFNNIVRTLHIKNGYLYVGGSFTSFNGDSTCQRIVKLDLDGNLISNFNYGSTFNNHDSKILVGGDFTSFNGKSSRGLARLGNSAILNLHQCVIDSKSSNYSISSVGGYSLWHPSVYSYETYISSNINNINIIGDIIENK